MWTNGFVGIEIKKYWLVQIFYEKIIIVLLELKFGK
jgi:hypothetical protein